MVCEYLNEKRKAARRPLWLGQKESKEKVVREIQEYGINFRSNFLLLGKKYLDSFFLFVCHWVS